MIKLSFPTRKLGDDIVRVNTKFKDIEEEIDTTVLGVTNLEGITVTGKKASDDLSKYIVIKGKHFAYNPYRINVGSIGLTESKQQGLVSPAYIVFKTKNTLIPEFLLYYLKSSIGLNLIQWYGNRGGVRDALRFGDLCKIDIPDLSVEQQLKALQKIKKVEEKNTLLNREIEKQTTLLNKYRELILKDAISGKLVEQDENDGTANTMLEYIKEEKKRLIKEKIIKKERPLTSITEEDKPHELPKGWQWVKLADIAYISTGSTPLKDNPLYYENGDIAWCTSTITGSDFVSKPNKFVTSLAVKECNLKIYPVGTLLMAMYGQGKTRGQTTELLIESTINQACAAIQLIEQSQEHKDYIKLCLMEVYNKVREEAVGGAQPNLNQSKVKNIFIPLPPKKEQKKIVKKTYEILSKCTDLKNSIEQSRITSEDLMKAILQESFTVEKTEVFIGGN